MPAPPAPSSPPPSPRLVLVATAATATGAVLRGAVSVIARRRSAARPLHPRGSVELGRLRRRGAAPRTGSPFLDDPGEDEVLVRLSRGLGLPEPWPDVSGLALRVPRVDGGVGDLLMTTTGAHRPTRWLLVPHTRTGVGRFSTLVPYRTSTGAVLVGARAVSPRTFVLSWARPWGRWHDFADLELHGDPGADPVVSFDPVLRLPDGLGTYDWVARVREPAYDVARRLRRRSGGAGRTGVWQTSGGPDTPGSEVPDQEGLA